MNYITSRDVALLIGLAALCVIGVIILSATGHDVPQVLGDLAFTALGGGAGVARNNATTVTPPVNKA